MINKLPTATSILDPNRSKIGPTWTPTKKTMKRYRLKIQPISEGVWCFSWLVEKYDSKTAAEFINPYNENMAQKDPNTTSHP